MKIVIFAKMPEAVYSGGRYFTWILAEALAAMGQEVTLVTDHMPIFARDFIEYPCHDKIDICIQKDLAYEPQGEIDYVYCIPESGFDAMLYHYSLSCACKSDAQLVLLNFETPNWFNLYFPQGRSVEAMEKYGELCRYGCIIQSFADVSQKYAKEFYIAYPQTTTFDVWNPVINSVVADRIQVEKENQIVAMVRMTDKHKGGRDIIEIVGPFMQDWKLVCIVGNGRMDSKIIGELEEKAKECRFTLEIKFSLSDEEKFTEIRKSKILMFPSYFEGYGYPPVEAQYCDTMCVAYDLPVVREISGDAIRYAKYGDVADFSRKLEECILECTREDMKWEHLKDNIKDRAEFYCGAEKLTRMLEGHQTDGLIDEQARKQYIEKCKNEPPDTMMETAASAGMTPELYRIIVEAYSDESMEVHHTWDDFYCQSKGKKIAVFGDGKGLEWLLEQHPDFPINVILDNNVNKWNRESTALPGVMIQSPEILWDEQRQANRDKDYVVLITNYRKYREIEEQLQGHGIQNIFCFLEMEFERLKKQMNILIRS
jgi:glycosyltransferase involved in cell wall biosynthesis